MVAAGANAADLGDYLGQLLYRSAFAEFFKTPEFRDLKIYVIYIAVVFAKNLDFTVALETGNGIYGVTLFHVSFLLNKEAGKLKR
jgi:hypothetical protein